MQLHDSELGSGVSLTDIFCGCGGSSTGAVQAGIEVDMAINHWDLAIETHNTNHPDTDHDCNDVSRCDPRRYPRTKMLWASPECVTHSVAGGGKYDYEDELARAQRDLFAEEPPDQDVKAQRSRATMGDVVRFTRYHRYEIVIVENVVDIKRWPLFTDWVKGVRKLGYLHREVYLNSLFCHPTPQTRDRVYVVFWKKGNPAPDLDIRPPAHCRACAEEVEAVQSWRDTKLGRQQWGRYGKRQQYIYRCPRCASVVKPYYYAGFNAIDWSIDADRIGERSRPLADKTMQRIRYGLREYGRKPLVVTTRYTSGTACRVRDATAHELPTQPGDASHALLSPAMVQTAYSHAPGNRAYSALEALRTQTAQQSMGLLSPPPMLTSTNYFDDRNVSLEAPYPTQTTQTKWAITQPPVLSKQYSTFAAAGMADPTGTVTTSDHHGLVTPPGFIAEMFGTSNAKPLSEALGCVTAGGVNYALIDMRAFASYYYSSGVQVSGMDEALGTMTTRDRVGLTEAPSLPEAPGPDADEGAVEEWVDAVLPHCTFRMLKSHECKVAMALPRSYVVLGNQRQRVKQVGNAVTPPAARDLLQRCAQTLA